MVLVRLAVAAGIAVSSLLSASTFAQADAGQCILAGRLSADRQWAPRFAGVELLGANGQLVRGSGKDQLANVKQARLAQPALLSRCDGSNALTLVPGSEPAATKTPAPALSAGLVDVESVAYPKLRTGGELVELKVRVPAERVVMLTR